MAPFPDGLNEQVGHEFAASQQYVAIAVHYDAQTLPRLAAHFYRQAVEERNHAMMIVQYLLDSDERVAIPGVEAPQTEFADVVEPVRLALEQEKRVTQQISDLAKLARTEGDLVGEQFLHWFLQEQREEVSSMAALLTVVERSRDNVMLIEDFLARETVGRRRRRRRARRRRQAARSSAGGVGIAARTCSATASSSTAAPVTSFSSSSAVGRCPSAHRSVRSEPASRRLNQSLPNSSRMKLVICAENAHARR